MRPDIEHLLWYLTVGCETVLLLRLFLLHIAGKYRCFTAYVSALLIQDIALLTVSRSGAAFATNRYGLIWITTEPVLLVLLIASTLEAYRLVHRYYPGVDDAGQRFVQRVGIIALLACILSLLPDLRTTHWQPTLSLLFVLKRSVSTIGAVLLTLVLAVTLLVPVLMPRNIKTHFRLVLAYVAKTALGYFGLNVWWFSRDLWAKLLMGSCVICFVLWTVLMTRAGEIQPEPNVNCLEDPNLDAQWRELRAVARTAPKLFRFWRSN